MIPLEPESDAPPRITHLVALFDDAVLRHRDSPAVGERDTSGAWVWTSYGQLAERAEQARAILHKLGVRPGDRVAVCAPAGVAWAAACLGILQAGASVAAVHEAAPPHELKFVLADARAAVVLVGSDATAQRVMGFKRELPLIQHVVRIDPAPRDVTSFEALSATLPRAAPPKVPLSDAGIAHVVYSAGTSLRAKGARLSHGALTAAISTWQTSFPPRPGELVVSSYPWNAILGLVGEFYGTIACGGALVVPRSAADFAVTLREWRPTQLVAGPHTLDRLAELVHLAVGRMSGWRRSLLEQGLSAIEKRTRDEVPTLSERLLEPVAQGLALSHVRGQFGGRLSRIVCGDTSQARTTLQLLDQLQIDAWETYTVTEAGGLVAWRGPAERRAGKGLLLAAGVSVAFEARPGVPEGTGELVVQGPSVMHGDDPVVDRPFVGQKARISVRTGDLAKLDAQGHLWILGRCADQYRLATGHYVIPGRTESAILQSPFIAQAVVCGDGRRMNAAVVVPAFAALRQWARAQKITLTDLDLAAEPRVQKLLSQEVARTTAQLPMNQRVGRCMIVPERFGLANGLLTPVGTVRRNDVVRQYHDELKALFEAATRPDRSKPAERSSMDAAIRPTPVPVLSPGAALAPIPGAVTSPPPATLASDVDQLGLGALDPLVRDDALPEVTTAWGRSWDDDPALGAFDDAGAWNPDALEDAADPFSENELDALESSLRQPTPPPPTRTRS